MKKTSGRMRMDRPKWKNFKTFAACFLCLTCFSGGAEGFVAPVLRMPQGGWRAETELELLSPVVPVLCQMILFGKSNGEAATAQRPWPENRESLIAEDLNKGMAREEVKTLEEGLRRDGARSSEEGARQDASRNMGNGIWEEDGKTEADPDPAQEAWDLETIREEKPWNPEEDILIPESMTSFEELIKNYYLVDSTTMADEELLRPVEFLKKDMRVEKSADGPQILIYHTHSQEAFRDSKAGDPSQSVVGVGEELARILREEYGYEVMHHQDSYDLPSRNGAYSKALPVVRRLLEENPSIQVVIDLHRDEMPENVHLVTEMDGKKTAKFMFFNGISRTKTTGELEYLHNENLEENLAFSLQMEVVARQLYPGLTRRIYLKGYRYNMHLCPKTLLIELGAQNNTLEEAMNACEPLAKILDRVLSGKTLAIE